MFVSIIVGYCDVCLRASVLCWLLQGVSVAVLASVWNHEAGYCRVALLVYAIIICVMLC